MNQNGIITLIQLAILFLIAVLAVKIQSSPSVIGKTGSVQSFSAERAMDHLKVIAQSPHSGGTPEHQFVRNYITNYCKSYDLEVAIQDTMAFHMRNSFLSASHVSNIIAIKRGKKPGKHILAMSHYDSQPNTPGAADDGAGVVAMLESIRALSEFDTLNHDIVFLFTDQEEVGLLGAEAFVNTHPLVQNTGVLMNFESRGNRGPAFTFEVNQKNGWIIRQFAKGAPTPIASSMAYEIYKVMPNDSDFSKFRKDNFTGLNQANVNGFAHYHSMTDDIFRIDPRIIQHHGENLLGMILHLDTIDLNETKAPDLNFFNPVGQWLVYYPVKYNLPLIALCILLFVVFIYLNRSVPGFNFIQVLLGLGSFVLVLMLTLLVLFAILKLILWLYPHYSNFYGNNFYNAPIYFWMFSGITWITFGLVYNGWGKHQHVLGQFCGVLVFHLMALIALAIYFPTATYAIYYPLIVLLLFLNIKLIFSNPISPLWFLTAGLIPMVLLWAPIIFILFVVFALVLPYTSVVLLSMLSGLLIPLFRTKPFTRNNMMLIGVTILLISFLLGHLSSKPTMDRPLQTNLSYFLDHDQNEAYWISTNPHQDDWTANYVSKKSGDLRLFEKWSSRPIWIGEAPRHTTSTSSVDHHVESIGDSVFNHTFTITPDSTTISLIIRFDNLNSNGETTIDGRPVPLEFSEEEEPTLQFHAVDPAGLKLHIPATHQDSFSLTVIDRSLRIPESWLAYPRPIDYIPGPGSYSDAIFQMKTYNY